jgi:multiple antibiotic resistance protein
MHRSERRRIAWRASLYAAIIPIVAVIIGQIVLDAMGIRLRSLQVAGGVILFVFWFADALRLDESTFRLRGGRSGFSCFPTGGAGDCWSRSDHGHNPLTDNDVHSVNERAQRAVVLLVVLVLNYILLLLSDVVLRIIGRQGAAVLTRVMGIILSSLAVEFVLTGMSMARCPSRLHVAFSVFWARVCTLLQLRPAGSCICP